MACRSVRVPVHSKHSHTGRSICTPPHSTPALRHIYILYSCTLALHHTPLHNISIFSTLALHHSNIKSTPPLLYFSTPLLHHSSTTALHHLISLISLGCLIRLLCVELARMEESVAIHVALIHMLSGSYM